MAKNKMITRKERKGAGALFPYGQCFHPGCAAGLKATDIPHYCEKHVPKRLQTEFFLKDMEVTEERYDEMLGVVYPEKMLGNGFLVGEPTDHRGEGGQARFELYFIAEEKYYYGGLATVKEFELWTIPRS